MFVYNCIWERLHLKQIFNNKIVKFIYIVKKTCILNCCVLYFGKLYYTVFKEIKKCTVQRGIFLVNILYTIHSENMFFDGLKTAILIHLKRNMKSIQRHDRERKFKVFKYYYMQILVKGNWNTVVLLNTQSCNFYRLHTVGIVNFPMLIHILQEQLRKFQKYFGRSCCATRYIHVNVDFYTHKNLTLL